MSKTATSVVEQTDFYRRLQRLKRRQSRSFWIMLSSVLLLLLCIAAALFQQQLVYSFFDLRPQLTQLHLPVSVEVTLNHIAPVDDYFARGMSWVGWLLLKIVLSIIAATMFMRLIRSQLANIKRFKRYLSKLLLWCLAFVMLFSGMSIWQEQRDQRLQQPYQQLMAYDQQILDSPLAQYLTQSQQPEAMQAYLLAQTALLHQPKDQIAAKYYADRLRQAEGSGVDFNALGLDSQTLWSIQDQVYGKSLTPLAEQVALKVQQAQHVSKVLAWLLYGLMLMLVLTLLISYLLSRTLHSRQQRVSAMLDGAGIDVNRPPRIEQNTSASTLFTAERINQSIDLSKKAFKFVQRRWKGPKL